MLNIGSYLRKARILGVRGLNDYAIHLIRMQHLTCALRRNAERYPYPHPERGITLLADFSSPASLCKVMRDFARSIKAAQIPLQAFDIGTGRGGVPESDYRPLLTPRAEFRYARYSHIVEMFTGPAPALAHHTLSNIGFWEFDEGFLEAHPPMRSRRDVIGMSDYNVAVFRRAYAGTPTRVTKILYPFHLPQADIAERPHDTFTVFFNFDLGSSYARKNPEAALHAFAHAFPHEKNTRLVLKVMSAQKHPDALRRLESLADALHIRERLTFVTRYLPEAELYALTADCDVYLSLHRGEGFGLGIAEAMSLGKAVVATDYGATTEFCRRDVAVPVPCELVATTDTGDHACYTDVPRWAEADVDAASRALRDLYENPAKRRAIGEAARAFMKDYFSIENFRASVDAYLDGPSPTSAA